tara:strand:+ start:179 stop:832 length:654 start_codon:yes stop_codon:yes gene_type:complete
MKKINTTPDQQNYSLLLLAIMFLVFIMAILPWINIDTQKNLLIENGLFESLTVYGYISCLIIIFASWSWQQILSKWYFLALIILFTLRELDYDKAHFTHGVLKSKQYFSDLVGVNELFISIGILIFILTVLALIIFKEKNNFIRGIKALKQSQLAVLSSIILVIVTKTIDGSERKFDIDLSESGKRISLIIEEVGEMGIPIMFAIAILSYSKKKVRE